MNITETRNEGLEREYSIVVTAAEIEAKIDAKLAELSQTVKMPGFRPGKVPASVVKARFGDQAKGEVIRTALDDGAKEAIEGNSLRLASQPSVDIEKYEDGGDMEAILKCEVMPQIDLPDFAAMSVERPTMSVDESEVDETMSRISEENIPTVPAEDGKSAEMGDTTIIDFVGSIDGEEFEGGAGNDHPLKLGSNRFIPGFEEGLVGVKKGDKRDVNVTFPAEYQASHLAGKEAVFAVTVKDIQVDGEATLDDELAKKLGFETVDELRNAVRDQIGSQHAGALRQAVKRNLLDVLATNVDFDIPPSLFSSEYDQVARAMKAELGIEDHSHDHDHDHDHDHHHHAADEGLDDEQKAEATAVATRRVRLGLLLTETGTSNNIQVSEEDTRMAVFEQARRYPGQEQQVVEYYQKNPQAMQQLSGPIFEDKVVDFILEMAKVTETETTAEELYASLEETTAKPAAKKAAKKSAKKAAKKAAAKKAPAKKAAAKKAAAKKK